MPSQISEEVVKCFDFLAEVYGLLGFKFEFQLSTRPEEGKYIGSVELWDQAEAALKKALDDYGHPYTYDIHGGAFYGPKIDIKISDAMNRKHQCATIQLDYQLPIRFDLEYVPKVITGEKHRPVIIHRAILGSLERSIAILCEHFKGVWPFWLSPRQAIVIPVLPLYNAYAIEVSTRLKNFGYMVDVNVNDSEQMAKKIRNGAIDGYKYIFIVGEKEEASDSVDVRGEGLASVTEIIAFFSKRSKLRTPMDFPYSEERAIVKVVKAQEGNERATKDLERKLKKINERLAALEN